MNRLIEKKIRIHFANKDCTKKLALTFQLYDHRLIDRWLALYLDSGLNIKKFGQVNFTGQILENEEQIIAILNALILKINTYFSKNNINDLSIDCQISRNVEQKTLNDLHRFFEVHFNDKRFHADLRNTFNMLNLFIHKMENFSDSKKNKCVNIDINPLNSKYLKFELEDFLLFDPNWRWGELILNYGLRGVPTLLAFQNDSIPRPQGCFNGGCTISFVEDTPFTRHEDLGPWLIKNNLNLNDPECALGNITLGNLIDPIIPKDELARLNFLLQFKEINNLVQMEYIGSSDDLISISASDHEILGKYDIK
jgi:hypothetical protein